MLFVLPALPTVVCNSFTLLIQNMVKREQTVPLHLKYVKTLKLRYIFFLYKVISSPN